MAAASLIPKNIPSPAQSLQIGLGVFFRIAVFLFIAVALLCGGLFLYGSILKKQIADRKAELEKLESGFSLETIADFEKLAQKINTAESLLRKHVRTSSVFTLLENNTLPEVAFTSFAYTEDHGAITLSGEAVSYATVAAQSAVFETLQEVASATFSNLNLRETGRVGFSITVILKK